MMTGFLINLAKFAVYITVAFILIAILLSMVTCVVTVTPVAP